MIVVGTSDHKVILVGKFQAECCNNNIDTP